MNQEWYIDDGTRVVGPVTPGELRAWARDGRLRPTDRVSPNQKSWRLAEQIKGLEFPEPMAVAAPTFDSAQTIESPITPTPSDPYLSGDRPATPRPGDEVTVDIPGYLVTGVLGSGACGVVYEARQSNLDRVVALKTVKMSARLNPTMASRFEKEAVALGRLQHPNIVSVFDCGRFADQVYFAMEVLRGQDLSQRIAKSGPVDERTAWAVARQTAAALGHAAADGIFHRDVKPANLFLTKMPTGFGLPPDLPMVKVTDFGLAMTRRTEDTSADVKLTAAGVVLGTPTYMAPEQFKSPNVDHRADIYSLGATMYHALTGEVPFPGASVWDVMMRKAEGLAPRPGPPVSDESADLVVEMMAPDPGDRIQTYEELIARIDALPAMAGVVGSSTVVEAPRSRIVSKPSLEPPKPPVPDGLLATEFGVLPTPSAPPPARRHRLARTAAITTAVGLAVGAAVIGAVAVGNRSDGDPLAERVRAGVKYGPGPVQESLFNGKDTLGWGGSGGVARGEDDEGTPVLEFERTAKRSFTRPQHFQLVIGLDLHEAKTVYLTACVPSKEGRSREEDEAAPRLTVRVTRDGATFGTRAGDKGEFTPLPSGVTVPFPSAAETKGSSPYREVRLELSGGVWQAFFHNSKLGAARDDGPPKLPELRIQADGPVRLDSVSMEELVPGK